MSEEQRLEMVTASRSGGGNNSYWERGAVLSEDELNKAHYTRNDQ
jgi:hypothetical protein